MKTALLIFVMLLTTTTQNVVEHYSKDGLAFDYPAGWTLGDTTDAKVQRVMLTPAEVYSVVLGQRLLHLVHVRADKDDAAGAAAWKSVLDSLKVEGTAAPEGEAQVIAGGVLNQRAVKKPAPDYPPIAKSARASGTVTVQLVVDEKGNVVSAVARS